LYQLNRPCEFSLFFGPVRFTSAQLMSSPLFPLLGATSPPADIVMMSRSITLPFYWTKMSSLPLLYLLAMMCPVASPLDHLPSQTETEALNLHHCHRLPSSDRPTPTLYCYKVIIATLATLPTTQPRLYFASSLASAPRHQSSTRRHCSLSLLSHAHRPSAQWHPQWRSSRPSFASRTTYWYINSHKKIFWNATASRGVIN
jgi:hypothetical protein